MDHTWQLIATERTRLAAALSELSAPQWAAPSLCAGWDNADVLAHIVSTAEITAATFITGMVRNGFNVNRMVAGDVERVGAAGVPALLDRLRAGAGSRAKPPGPVGAMLMETIVHGEDIAYPTGLKIHHTEQGMLGAAEFARTAQPLVGCRKRIQGLRLLATDHVWSTGTGPEVRGPLIALLLAMSGRQAAIDELTGDGVPVLRRRP
ncbi:maleylpyruvate isomerase family mycothiol-dependent enzyme [Pseudonocardia sp. H11422]|uniref:maleylpyruvate isomerase family mycothiol-dependent enzyme n=1 Tax=Pseudonocardia sp. H11422 TaxID=2835866 RepID=UPI001BDC867F|nr:maleylpyruvate isomerase family mycothiol-dependent enzyme [Pseudonocardia sp. H11422]